MAGGCMGHDALIEPVRSHLSCPVNVATTMQTGLLNWGTFKWSRPSWTMDATPSSPNVMAGKCTSNTNRVGFICSGTLGAGSITKTPGTPSTLSPVHTAERRAGFVHALNALHHTIHTPFTPHSQDGYPPGVPLRARGGAQGTARRPDPRSGTQAAAASISPSISYIILCFVFCTSYEGDRTHGPVLGF